MIVTLIHYFLHLLFPLLIARLFFPQNFWKANLIFLLTMAVDLDHLVADPIFDPNRCSIGFHPLHTYGAMAVYLALCFKKGLTRIAGIGLLFHMLTDQIDCWLHNL